MNRGNATHMIALMGALGADLSTIDDLDRHLPLTRRQISIAAGRLVSRGLIARAEIGTYRLTELGQVHLQEGRRLTSGPRGAHTGVRAPALDTLRQRAWAAMRLAGRFALADILLLAMRDGDGDGAGNLRRYIRHLARTGYVIELPERLPGAYPTSNGHKLYRLVRDTGDWAPVLRSRGRVFDPNTGEVATCR